MSASGPTTATSFCDVFSGSAPGWFLSSTAPSVAALRASRRWAGLLMTDLSIEPYLPPPGSNSPRRTRTDRMCPAASFTSASFNRPFSSADLTAPVVTEEFASLSVKLSMPALIAAASPSTTLG